MMKRIGMVILALVLSAGAVKAQQAPAKAPATPPAKAPAASPAAGQAAQPPAAKAPDSPFKTQKEKFSYAIGMEMGKGVKSQQIDVDPDIVMQGLKDALADGKPQMSEEEIRQVIAELQAADPPEPDRRGHRQQEERRRLPGGECEEGRAWYPFRTGCSTRF